jgi:hypothetical protein
MIVVEDAPDEVPAEISQLTELAPVMIQKF